MNRLKPVLKNQNGADYPDKLLFPPERWFRRNDKSRCWCTAKIAERRAYPLTRDYFCTEYQRGAGVRGGVAIGKSLTADARRSLSSGWRTVAAFNHPYWMCVKGRGLCR